MIEIKGVDPTMIANNLVPENPTHPGEVLKEELESRNITQKSFADKTGLSRSVVSDVLNGRRGVNTEYALLFEAILSCGFACKPVMTWPK